jgi:hypothetical protein
VLPEFMVLKIEDKIRAERQWNIQPRTSLSLSANIHLNVLNNRYDRMDL